MKIKNLIRSEVKAATLKPGDTFIYDNQVALVLDPDLFFENVSALIEDIEREHIPIVWVENGGFQFFFGKLKVRKVQAEMVFQ